VRAVLLLCAVVALAGCLGATRIEESALSEDDHGVPPPTVQNDTGRVVVLALFTDRSPLPGVLVETGNLSATTDAEGVARLALPAGFHTLVATKAAHRGAQAGIDVAPGAETTVEMVLASAEGGSHAHRAGFGAHHDTYRFEGHFDCSLTAVVLTGDCLLLVTNATERAGAPDPVSGATRERHVIDFPLDLTWSHLIVEMTWRADPSTPATGEGMSLALEPAEAPTHGYAPKYARAAGGSPLRIDLFPGEAHASATADDKPNPLGGEVIRARAFVLGAGHNAGGQGYLGVSAARDHAFELVVTVFYGERAPEGYSGLA